MTLNDIKDRVLVEKKTLGKFKLKREFLGQENLLSACLFNLILKKIMRELRINANNIPNIKKTFKKL